MPRFYVRVKYIGIEKRTNTAEIYETFLMTDHISWIPAKEVWQIGDSFFEQIISLYVERTDNGQMVINFQSERPIPEELIVA